MSERTISRISYLGMIKLFVVVVSAALVVASAAAITAMLIRGQEPLQDLPNDVLAESVFDRPEALEANLAAQHDVLYEAIHWACRCSTPPYGQLGSKDLVWDGGNTWPSP